MTLFANLVSLLAEGVRMRIPAEVFPEMFRHWHGQVHFFRFGNLVIAWHRP